MAAVQSCRSTTDPVLESSTRADIGASSQSVEHITARLNTNDDVAAPPGSSTLYTVAGTTLSRKSGRLTCAGATATREANTTKGSTTRFMIRVFGCVRRQKGWKAGRTGYDSVASIQEAHHARSANPGRIACPAGPEHGPRPGGRSRRRLDSQPCSTAQDA